MKVVLLCAGRSKRLKPVEDKNLLKFMGEPLVKLRMESLARFGLTEFIIVAGEHNLEALQKITYALPYEIEFVKQENLDEGMAGAIKSAQDVIDNNPILVVSTNDSVENKLIERLKNAVEKEDPEALIVGKQVEKYFPGGYLQVDENGHLTRIIEKPGPGNEPSNMINLVYHYFKEPDKLVTKLEKTKSSSDDIYEVALQSLIDDGLKISVLPYQGEWFAIKYPWHILDTAKFYHIRNKTKGIHQSAKIHSSAVVRGEVIIDENVKVDANAVINGPAYIGKNSIIGVNAFVRESFIGDNCVIGFSSEISRSYIGDDSWTHNNYVGDSIIGNNVSFGAGTLTGNLRFDEGEIVEGRNKLGTITGNNIRTGINCNLMPGIRIGSNSIISPGVNLAQDVPENSFVKAKTSTIVKENKLNIKPRK